jgi:pimeloyl-ACP methyl ester carboxylesterase
MQNGTDSTSTTIKDDIFGFKAILTQSDTEIKLVKSRAILLMHSSGLNAENWVTNRAASDTLPFLIADLGYDVWLGNNRGVNDYSKHETLTEDDAQYWDYTFADMGKFDVSAMINFITLKTGLSKISYMGFERGNQQMFYALAYNEEYLA